MNLSKKILPFAVSFALTAAFANVNATPAHNSIQHVLLISIDGLHQQDLDWCLTKVGGVANCPNIAQLAKQGVEFNNALTPFPSDSFPGMVGQVTGGNPKTTGVYYDDEYSRSLVAAPSLVANATCTPNAANQTGAEVYYAEVIEPTINGNISLDAGQGIPNLYPASPLLVDTLVAGDTTSVPSSIFKLASSPNDVRNAEIDADFTLPKDPTTCQNIYPHQYMRVNTIFEVARAHGLQTAWVDKHPAYEIMNGPSGQGIADHFSPEINSVVDPVTDTGNDWTKDNTLTQKYDTIKVAAILNEIAGKDHAGINNAQVPAIFGMNFQVVSTAQKLNTSTIPGSSGAKLLGGYLTNPNGSTTPGPVVQSALHFVDNSLGQFTQAINANPVLQNSFAIIVSAKHGQSSMKRADVRLIVDGNNSTTFDGTDVHQGLTDVANYQWAQYYTNKYGSAPSQTLIAHPMDDDGILWWLNYRTPEALNWVTTFLNNYHSGLVVNGVSVVPAVGSDANGNATQVAFDHAGLATNSAGNAVVYTGAAAAALVGVNAGDDCYPDVIGIAKTGSVYVGKPALSKIAEHGGGNAFDRQVPILVSAPGVNAGSINSTQVETTQIAPTILNLLSINPNELQAVVAEQTPVLPLK
jgi:predicted AlkP superfamily pyrophosphatase or phosphodiesterase